MLGDTHMLILGALKVMMHWHQSPKLVVFPIGLMSRTVLTLEKHMETEGLHLQKGVRLLVLASHPGISLDNNHFTQE